MTRLRLLFASMIVCVAAVAMVPSADAARKMEIAVADDNVFLKGLWDPFTGFRKARDLNATWVRVNVGWDQALGSQADERREPSNITYNWTPWDDLIARAANEGLKVELTLVGPAPRWASGNRKSGFPIVRPNARKFGQFARAAAEHFDGRVERYTIWNEGNLKAWLSPKRRAPAIYRKLYDSAYRNINAVDSDNKVFIGETAPYGQRGRTTAPLKWLRGVTRVNSRYRGHRGKTLLTDGYAHHPYDYKHKPTYRYPGKDNVTVATLGRLERALSRLRAARALRTPSGGVPYIYLTEYGYFAAYKYRLPQAKHARFLKKGFKIAQRNPRVKQMLQYLLVQPPSKTGFFATHIMSRSFKPYRAYTVLRRWARRQARRGGVLENPLN
jgi:hypothetical protein